MFPCKEIKEPWQVNYCHIIDKSKEVSQNTDGNLWKLETFIILIIQR